MKQILRYIILAVIVIGLLYVYFTMPETTEKGINFTPKEVIQSIEQRKSDQRSDNNPSNQKKPSGNPTGATP